MPTEPQESSDSQQLAEKLLSLSFVHGRQGFRFSKTEHAKYPELVYEEVEKYLERYKIDAERLVILATSGIPFGMVLSQALELPVHIYRRNGWEITEGTKDRTYHALPVIPQNSRLTLVDSHSRRRKTANDCYKKLVNSIRAASVSGLITFIGLDHFPPTIIKLPFPESGMISIKENCNFLSDLLSSPPELILSEILGEKSDIWKEAWRPVIISAKRNIGARILSAIGTPTRYPTPVVLDALHGKMLVRSTNLKTNMGIWSIFSEPGLLRTIGQSVAKAKYLENFDAVVGVQAIGSGVAWAAAFHSRYRNPVFSTYESPKFLPFPGDAFQGKRVLLVQGRVITGLDTEYAIDKIGKFGGKCNDVLSLWWMPELENPKRCAPLRRLGDRGVNFVTLLK